MIYSKEGMTVRMPFEIETYLDHLSIGRWLQEGEGAIRLSSSSVEVEQCILAAPRPKRNEQFEQEEPLVNEEIWMYIVKGGGSAINDKEINGRMSENLFRAEPRLPSSTHIHNEVNLLYLWISTGTVPVIVTQDTSVIAWSVVGRGKASSLGCIMQ